MAGRVTDAPNGELLEKKNPQADLWFQEVGNRMNVYTGTTNPTVASIPQGQWVLFNNTTLSEVRIWTNIAGVLKKSAAFT